MSTDSSTNIFKILHRVNHGLNLTLEEAEHIDNIARSRSYSKVVELLEQRTPDVSWLCCDESGLYFPDYQQATTVGALSDKTIFLPHIEDNLGDYEWAQDRYGDYGYTSDDDAVWVDCDNEYITRGRYEWQGYSRCDGCEEVFHGYDTYYREHADGTYCESCDPGEEEDEAEDTSSNTIYNYSTRIEHILPMHLTPGVRHFGIELEQEFPNDRPEEECSWAMDEYPDLAGLCIWKSDGSLSNGAELVSLPKPLDYWQSANPVQALCNDEQWRRVARSHKTTTCGLHVHVSRNTVPEPVIAKMVVLFNDPSMTETLSLVARRAPNTSYCQASKKRWLSDPNSLWQQAQYDWRNYSADKPDPVRYARRPYQISKKQVTQGGRYTPVNLTDNTIEFRIFRGTLHWPTIIASIEFCDASISFCQQFGASSMNAEAFNNFLRESITRKTYPALRDYLQLRTLLPKRKQKPDTADTSTECRDVPEAAPAATFVMDPYDGQRTEFCGGYYVDTPGDHFIAYRDHPVQVGRHNGIYQFELTADVQPGEIWWNSTRTCSLRVEPANVQI